MNAQAFELLPIKTISNSTTIHSDRRSLAFVEYKSVSRFRNGIDPYYIDNKTPPLVRNVQSVEFSQSYFKQAKTLSSIAQEPTEIKLKLDEYDNANAGSFLRTIAFIHLLRSGARGSEISSQQMLTLMNNTTKIAELAHLGELRDFFDTPNKDALTRYLSQAVISDCSRQRYRPT